MIQLSSTVVPDQGVIDKLKEYQKEIDLLATFEQQSKKAKDSFSSRNKIGNPTFDAVKVKLAEMCSGARRCVYCEDSVGDEVEHIHPKDLYPEHCFQWENYVYACGSCNGPKNNKFAVFRADNGQFHEVNPPRGTRATKPAPGEAALINPRTEDPLTFCMLDIDDTFNFVVIATDARKKEKAAYTFTIVLRLNREFLRQARKNAYGNFSARLSEYVNQKKKNAPIAKLSKLINGIKSEAHPTVWKEMQRYFQKGLLEKVDSDLNELFHQAPEALTW
jgi:uncharacterized protein (TIGR02646 family)